jgi:hypothetical protein
MRVAETLKRPFEFASGVAATMAMLFAGKTALLLLSPIIDCAQAATSHA